MLGALSTQQGGGPPGVPTNNDRSALHAKKMAIQAGVIGPGMGLWVATLRVPAMWQPADVQGDGPLTVAASSMVRDRFFAQAPLDVLASISPGSAGDTWPLIDADDRQACDDRRRDQREGRLHRCQQASKSAHPATPTIYIFTALREAIAQKQISRRSSSSSCRRAPAGVTSHDRIGSGSRSADHVNSKRSRRPRPEFEKDTLEHDRVEHMVARHQHDGHGRQLHH